MTTGRINQVAIGPRAHRHRTTTTTTYPSLRTSHNDDDGCDDDDAAAAETMRRYATTIAERPALARRPQYNGFPNFARFGTPGCRPRNDDGRRPRRTGGFYRAPLGSPLAGPRSARLPRS
jgi:hypothetical protein